MKKILLLDDEYFLIKLLRIILKQYSLVEATTAQQALKLFAYDRQIHLLVAEVTLPISSGIQVALLLRLEIPDLPVILTSGFPLGIWTERNRADLERLGSNSVMILQKPFYPKVLLNAVCELIGAPTEMVRTA